MTNNNETKNQTKPLVVKETSNSLEWALDLDLPICRDIDDPYATQEINNNDLEAARFAAMLANPSIYAIPRDHNCYYAV